MSADKRSVCVSPRRYPRKRNRLLLVTAQPFYDIIPPLSSWRHDASPIEIQLHPHHARLPTTMYRIIKFHKGGARHLPAAQTNQRVKFSTSQSLRLVWSEKKKHLYLFISIDYKIGMHTSSFCVCFSSSTPSHPSIHSHSKSRMQRVSRH